MRGYLSLWLGMAVSVAACGEDAAVARGVEAAGASGGAQAGEAAAWTASDARAAGAAPAAAAGAAPAPGAEAEPVVGERSIELQLVRLSSGRGGTTVSSAVPLPPGMLRPAQLQDVVLLVEGAEQPVHVAALSGRHRDGSLRAVLVQTRYDVPAGAPVPAELVIGRRRTAAALPKTTPRYSYAAPLPQAAALPVSDEYLIGTGIVGETVPAPSTFDVQYEQSFRAHSDKLWERFQQGYAELSAEDLGREINYYDRALSHYAWWARTGDAEYWKRATKYLVAWRERYLRREDSLQPHGSQVEGLALHYLLTGDEQSRADVAAVAEKFAEVWTPQIGDPEAEWTEGRIQARTILAHLAAWEIGAPGRDWARVLRSDVDAVLGTQNPDGSYSLRGTCGSQFNFMVGLVNDALAKYHARFEADPRVVASVRKAVDYLWRTQWVPSKGSFRYASSDCGDGGEPSPDLNLLIAPGFGFVYDRTGEAAYRQRGDTVFREGVKRAWVGGEKHFNQQYYASFRYLAYRR